jgi:hypothetical protein
MFDAHDGRADPIGDSGDDAGVGIERRFTRQVASGIGVIVTAQSLSHGSLLPNRMDSGGVN